MTLHDAISRFTRQLRTNACSPHTVGSYACDLRALERFLEGGIPVKHISAHALAAFLTSPDALCSASGRPKGPGAVNRLRAVLRSFFRWLIETGHIRSNPAATLRVRSHRQPAPRMLADPDRKKLLAMLGASDDPLALRDRVIKVERHLAIGSRRQLKDALRRSEDSSSVNTSFIERLNLTIRQGSAYLGRRSPCHARWREHLDDSLELLRCHYNFVRPHGALKVGREVRTPAMQAGLVSQRLSFREIFMAVAGMLLCVSIAVDFRSPWVGINSARIAA